MDARCISTVAVCTAHRVHWRLDISDRRCAPRVCSGGAFHWGSAADFDGGKLAISTGCVVIAVQYRLGPLGFFQDAEIARENHLFPANGGANGIFDMITALRWVSGAPAVSLAPPPPSSLSCLTEISLCNVCCCCHEIEDARSELDDALAFAGDANRITVFGDGLGGGLGVCSLVVSPWSGALFQRAIITSGPCSGPWQPWEKDVAAAKCVRGR